MSDRLEPALNDICSHCGQRFGKHFTNSDGEARSRPYDQRFASCPGPDGLRSDRTAPFSGFYPPKPAAGQNPAFTPQELLKPVARPACVSDVCPVGSGVAAESCRHADPLGLGPDAPVVTNAAGGRQSHTPYRCDLFPPHAFLAVATVLEYGARKYGADNWHAITVAEHLNHAIGHLFAFLAGDAADDHLEHAACRVVMALDQKRSGREGGGSCSTPCS